MLASHQLPVVFLAQVQGPARGRASRVLSQECKTIAQLLDQPALPYYQPVHKGPLSTEYYLNLLGDAHYHRRITHLHLVGSAQSDSLMLASEAGDYPLTLDDLAYLVDALPRLSCVFLSGCATRPLVELLLRKDVPAIVATQARDDFRTCNQVAHAFYQYLAHGESLRDTFGLVRRQFKQLRSYRIYYDVEADQMKGVPFDPSSDAVPWGLYYLKENAPCLARAPRRRPVLKSTTPRRHKRLGYLRRLSFASLALILGLLTVTLVLSLQASRSWPLLTSF